MHGGNNFFTPDGAITVFDFDHSGFGWRAYDLAAFLWGAPPERRDAVLAGYEALRPLTAAEKALLPDFLRVRAIWDDGDISAMVDVWGTVVVARNAGHLARTLRALD